MTIFSFRRQESSEEPRLGEAVPAEIEHGEADEIPFGGKVVHPPDAAVTPCDYWLGSGLFSITYRGDGLYVQCPGCGAEAFVRNTPFDRDKPFVHADSSCRIARRADWALMVSEQMVAAVFAQVDLATMLRSEHLQFEKCSESDWVISYRVPDIAGVALRLKLHIEHGYLLSFECEVCLGPKRSFQKIAEGRLDHLLGNVHPDPDLRIVHYVQFPKGWREEFLAMAELWATLVSLVGLGLG